MLPSYVASGPAKPGKPAKSNKGLIIGLVILIIILAIILAALVFIYFTR